MITNNVHALTSPAKICAVWHVHYTVITTVQQQVFLLQRNCYHARANQHAHVHKCKHRDKLLVSSLAISKTTINTFYQFTNDTAVAIGHTQTRM